MYRYIVGVVIVTCFLILLQLFEVEKPTVGGSSLKSFTDRSNTYLKKQIELFSSNASSVAKDVSESRLSQRGISLRTDDSGVDPVRELPMVLKPRVPHPKGPLRLPPGTQHAISVKFSDAVMARSDGLGGVIVSMDEIPEALQKLVEEHEVAFVPLFDRGAQLDALRVRAAMRSGEMPPDLNGTMRLLFASNKPTLEVAKAFQQLAIVESVEMESLDMPPPPPGDIAPVTPNLTGFQGYFQDNPGYGVTTAHALGVLGQGVRFSDCEYGYNPDHEDLVDSGITYASPAPINSQVYTNGWDDHGTAVMGINAAAINSYGISGIAPETDKFFYSEWTTNGYNRFAAVQDAILDSEEGDVVLLEMQANGDSGYAPAELSSSIWNITKIATDAGIIVVAAAGNGNQNLDSSVYDYYNARGDSGAIMVGSGFSDSTHQRISDSTYGSRLNVQAWGVSIFTLGYGNYTKYGNDDNQSYTSSFGGTSGASACVAGLVCLVQSYAKNTLDTIISPAEMRNFLATTGFPQGGSGGSIGPAVSVKEAIKALPGTALSVQVEPTSGDDLNLTFFGLPFRDHKVETSTDLDEWAPFQSGVAGDSEEVVILLEDFTADNFDKLFFRVVEE